MADDPTPDGARLRCLWPSDVFHLVVNNVFHPKQKPGQDIEHAPKYVAVVLMKGRLDGKLYIAAPVMKASLKHQGHDIGHSSWQAITKWDGALQLKRSQPGVQCIDNTCLDYILKAGKDYYRRATSRHMTMVLLEPFLHWLHNKTEWQVDHIKAALSSSTEFSSWLQQEPQLPMPQYIQQGAPAPQIPVPVPQQPIQTPPASPVPSSPADTVQAGSPPQQPSPGGPAGSPKGSTTSGDDTVPGSTSGGNSQATVEVSQQQPDEQQGDASDGEESEQVW
jgi:hypothetical protein